MRYFVFCFSLWLFLNPSLSFSQCGPSTPASFPLGAGLNGLADYDFDRPFNDVFKTNRGFSTNLSAPYSATPISADPNGWPLVDFGVVVMSNMDSTAGGTYKMRFNGQATINNLSNNYTVQNKAYDSITNTTTANLVFPAIINYGSNFIISFTNTHYTAGVNGIKNVQIMKPGLDFNAPTFDSTFLAHLSRFQKFRFMDWRNTNGNTDSLWQNRTLTTRATQVTSGGVAWEYCIELANMLHKDTWINVPHMADSNYIVSLANLLHDSLDPALRIYIEHSNEVWNEGFVQGVYNHTMAVKEAAVPGNILNYDSVNNASVWKSRRHALRCKLISDIFKNVFGTPALNNRFHVVVGVQSAGYLSTRYGIDFINDYFGDPSQYFYAIAIAPYFNCDATNADTLSTATEILNAFQNYLDSTVYPLYNNTLDRWSATAHNYNLHLLVYEGGPDTFGPNNVPAKHQATLTQRMKDICYNYLQQWFAYGFDGDFNWFTAGAGNWNTSFGTWSLTEHFENSFKLQAIDSLLATPVNQPTAGFEIPGTIDARKNTGYLITYNNSTYFTPTANSIYTEWLVRVPQDSAGTFNFQVQSTATAAGRKFIVYIDNILVDTVQVPDSGTAMVLSPPQQLSLTEGLHTIHIKYSGSLAFSIGNFVFTRLSPCIPNGIGRLSENEALSVYPNPANTFITVVMPENSPEKEIRIFDITGRCILHEIAALSSFNVNVTGFAPGIYFIKSGNQSARFLKD